MPQQSINALDRRLYSSQNDYISRSVTRSTEQTILVSDMISEGPIHGLIGGGTGVYLNNDSLQSAEETSMVPEAGVEATFTANSKTVTVDPGVGSFNAVMGNEGTKFLMVYGVHSVPVTMSDISPPTVSYVYYGNVLDDTDGLQKRRVPIGGKTTLTRATGETTNFEADWAHPSENTGYTLVDRPDNNAAFVSLKLSKSGHDLRGGLTNVNTTNHTATFTWGGYLNWRQLMSDADRANGVEHTLEVGRFLEIDTIVGNTITLKENAGFAGTKRFGVTATYLGDDSAGSERAIIEAKYVNSGYSFNTGTADQSALPTLE